MRKPLLATAALLAATMASNATTIDVGPNPTSATGHFSNNVGGGAFADFITFQLIGGVQFVTFASATNDFIAAGDFITGFTGQLFLQVGAPGGGDDIPQNPVVNAVPCPQNPGGCQILAGTALLNAGNYYLDLEGIGGGTAGYGGNITTLAVPGPTVGAGIPGLIAGCLALVGLGRRRRPKAS